MEDYSNQDNYGEDIVIHTSLGGVTTITQSELEVLKLVEITVPNND